MHISSLKIPIYKEIQGAVLVKASVYCMGREKQLTNVTYKETIETATNFYLPFEPENQT